MGDYNLERNEFVIMQQGQVTLSTGSDDEELDELVLSNKCLILVASSPVGLFRTARFLKRCPLDRIATSQDIPQAVAVKQGNGYVLRVAFDDEALTFSFAENPRSTAERWAEGIRLAAVGETSRVRTEDVIPPEARGVVDGARNFADAFAGAFGLKGPEAAKEPNVKMAPSVSAQCRGCHAPLSGRRGMTVTCPYCDTTQTL